MILDIVTIGDDRLKKKSEPIEKVNKEIAVLAEDMLETMYANSGIGLAAVQVGILKRLFVIDIPNVDFCPLVCINPEIVHTSRDSITYNEGCLSIPELSYDIIRPRSLILNYLDRDGTEKELTASGLLSVCIQHENDHLNGILFIENARDRERKKINKLLEKKQLPQFF